MIHSRLQYQTIALPSVSGMVNGTYRGACNFYGSSSAYPAYGALANKNGLIIG